MDKTLKKLYYNIDLGFLSLNDLYKSAKQQEPKITRKFVKEWLSKQEEYQIVHRPKQILYHPIISHVGEYQADIIFLDNEGNNNKQIGMITMIHVPTRYAYGFPISSRKTDMIIKGLNSFIDAAKKKDPIKNLTTDNELFNNITLDRQVLGKKLPFNRRKTVTMATEKRKMGLKYR